ncbi:uncharacterized protein LOC120356202, partial [Nilaparvata lugens]|uniref:uncharacterized protein LOC120356202 n=1 Tax=Nilaparvata lugens TaxID=108931 RepID=UPI00193E5D5D
MIECQFFVIGERILTCGSTCCRGEFFFSTCSMLSLARAWNRERNVCYINRSDERKIIIHIRARFEYTSRIMSSPSSSYILPDSPPQRILNYWQRKAALTAESTAAAPVPSPLSVEPASPRGEIIIPDSPLQRLAPAATWAPRRAVLTTVTNKQKQAKKRLLFEEPEVSGDEDESIFSQTKKRAGMEDNSSMVPLLEEVQQAGDELDFVQLFNQAQLKPWIPQRELKERTPYPIVAVREQMNIHGHHIILKIVNAGSE